MTLAPTDRAVAELDGRGLVLPPAGAHPLARAFGADLTAVRRAFLELAPPAYARAVRDATAREPRAALHAFAPAAIATPLRARHLRDALPAFRARIDDALAATAPHAALELALRGLLPDGAALEWPAARPLAAPALGVVLAPPAHATALRVTTRAVEALARGAPCAVFRFDAPHDATAFGVTRAYHPVGGGVTRLALVDHNPLAEFEAHPDKAGNHVSLGDEPLARWTASLDEAFAIIAAHLPEVFAEMRVMLHEVVPVGFDRERHLSASYREALGTAYLTLHPQVMTMAEALVHEFQHNKLNLASYGTAFLHNAFAPLYPSPVRPDPRPLWGILLAVHAFLPVAVLYRRMRAAGDPRAASPDFERRLSEVDLRNHEGMEMLRAHAEWTLPGRLLANELFALDAAHMDERRARGLAVAPTEVHPG